MNTDSLTKALLGISQPPGLTQDHKVTGKGTWPDFPSAATTDMHSQAKLTSLSGSHVREGDEGRNAFVLGSFENNGGAVNTNLEGKFADLTPRNPSVRSVGPLGHETWMQNHHVDAPKQLLEQNIYRYSPAPSLGSPAPSAAPTTYSASTFSPSPRSSFISVSSPSTTFSNAEGAVVANIEMQQHQVSPLPVTPASTAKRSVAGGEAEGGGASSKSQYYFTPINTPAQGATRQIDADDGVRGLGRHPQLASPQPRHAVSTSPYTSYATPYQDGASYNTTAASSHPILGTRDGSHPMYCGLVESHQGPSPTPPAQAYAPFNCNHAPSHQTPSKYQGPSFQHPMVTPPSKAKTIAHQEQQQRYRAGGTKTPLSSLQESSVNPSLGERDGNATNKGVYVSDGTSFQTPKTKGVSTPSRNKRGPVSTPPKSNSSSSPSSSSPSSPLPQNLKGDPHRQAKVKTELCLYYIKNIECPFGTRCNYAHGWEELKFKKLLDLERAGLITDASTYRTHPCMAWVSTGSCPFGQRCTSIHDPRSAGTITSWLPHADVPVGHLNTTINVDKFYHQNISTLHQTNPLVGQTYWEKCRPSLMKKGKKRSRRPSEALFNDNVTEDQQQVWRDTYELVCNLDRSKMSGRSNTTGRRPAGKKSSIITTNNKQISEEQRLSIALIMGYSSYLSDWSISFSALGSSSSSHSHTDYIYAPSHLIHNELCMVLQTRYFRLLSQEGTKKEKHRGSTLSSVREITQDEYNACRTPWDKRYPYSPRNVILVREIAFGPVGEPNANVSLWFDIASTDVVPCTPQMVKRFKRAKNRMQQQSPSKKNAAGFPPLPFHSHGASSSVASFQSPTHEPFFFMSLAMNDDASTSLVASILMHRLKVLTTWELVGGNFTEACENLAQEEVELQAEYQNLKKSMDMWAWPVKKESAVINEETKIPKCGALYSGHGIGCTGHVWDSFCSTMCDSSQEDATSGSQSRLGVFQKLARGESLSCHTSPPHINQVHTKTKTLHSSNNNSWEFILGGSEKENDKWQILRDNYLEESNGSPSASSPTSPTPARAPELPLSSNGSGGCTWSKNVGPSSL